MGYTASEFTNVLTGDFSGPKSELSCNRLCQNTWQIRLQKSDMVVEIQIDEKPQRVLGAMVIPVLQVNFHVTSSTNEQTDFFFKKFFKYFHKGGG